jgi:TPR repeat protein
MMSLYNKIAGWFKFKTTGIHSDIAVVENGISESQQSELLKSEDKRLEDAYAEMSAAEIEDLLKWGNKCLDVPYEEMSIEQKVMTSQYLAGLNNAEAQFQLGMFYTEGLGVKQDYEQAVVLYRRSAEQGFSQAQFNLGCMYDQGLGVPKSSSLAMNWHLKAANQGLATAQYSLGVYNEQTLARPNLALAASWYQKSADQGYIEAQYNLGLFYAKGLGVAKDQDKALTLFRKAAKQGHTNALSILKLHKLQRSI